MRVDSEILALRSDPASQRRMHARMEAAKREWRARGDVAAVLGELAGYGAGHRLERAAALGSLVNDPDCARRFVVGLVEHMGHALHDAPLGQIPFRHQLSGGICVVQLAEAGRAALSLVTYEGAALASGGPAQSVCFSDGELHEVCLAGSATARMFEITRDDGTRAQICSQARTLEAGATLCLAGPTQARLIDRVDGRLVMLRLGRGAAEPTPSREFTLEGGALLHRASGSREESRLEMAMALLGRMGRRDAAPQIAALAGQGGAHLRWQAVRNCLALDPAQGFLALSKLAVDADAALAAQAGALRKQLCTTYPVLAGMEADACPA